MRVILIAASVMLVACTTSSSRVETSHAAAVATELPFAATSTLGTLAQIYYWRAKPGKFDEYTRYVRDIAEPIDAEAHRRGAFVSVDDVHDAGHAQPVDTHACLHPAGFGPAAPPLGGPRQRGNATRTGQHQATRARSLFGNVARSHRRGDRQDSSLTRA